jgi:hypothetical protein
MRFILFAGEVFPIKYLRKLVAERDAVVRLLNERTELLNKLNAERAGK